MKITSIIVCATLLLSYGASAAAVSLEDAQFLAADIIKNKGRSGVQPDGVLLATPKPATQITALQKHISFFDKNGNGVITRSETALGLRQLGLGSTKAGATALVIHLFLGPKVSGRWNELDISVANIKLGKHGSDTGAFDDEGRFVPEAFERIFTEFDANHSGSMSADEIEAMITANSKLRPGSTVAAKQEFQLLLLIAADVTEKSGSKQVSAISKVRLVEFYDGSLFFKLAKATP